MAGSAILHLETVLPSIRTSAVPVTTAVTTSRSTKRPTRRHLKTPVRPCDAAEVADGAGQARGDAAVAGADRRGGPDVGRPDLAEAAALAAAVEAHADGQLGAVGGVGLDRHALCARELDLAAEQDAGAGLDGLIGKGGCGSGRDEQRSEDSDPT